MLLKLMKVYEITSSRYNLDLDPTEAVDLASDPRHANIKAQLFAMLQQHNDTTFTPNRGPVDPAACTAARQNGGFWGPWVA